MADQTRDLLHDGGLPHSCASMKQVRLKHSMRGFKVKTPKCSLGTYRSPTAHVCIAYLLYTPTLPSPVLAWRPSEQQGLADGACRKDARHVEHRGWGRRQGESLHEIIVICSSGRMQRQRYAWSLQVCAARLRFERDSSDEGYAGVGCGAARGLHT